MGSDEDPVCAFFNQVVQLSPEVAEELLVEDSWWGDGASGIRQTVE